jgi:CubicO group peptidase (beta-lactamase class C family)
MKNEYTKAIKQTAKIIDAWLPLKIQYEQIPALSVGIVHNGKLVYKRGFGFADLESHKPATADTSYRIASISKTFTSIAIMQLVEQGKLNLDDKVQKHLPWFKAKTKDSDAKNISIRQVMSHTAGIFRDGNTSHWDDDKFPGPAGLRKEISQAVVFENLTCFKYSNFGYALLGQVVAKASGISYDEYVKKNIIKRLGMKKTAPDFTEDCEKWLATGYGRIIPGKERQAYNHVRTNAYASATGFLANVSDLAKYLSALSLKRKGADALIGRESKKEIMRGHWATGEGTESYGLGFKIYKIGNRKIVEHSGGFCGYITDIALDVENDIGVITLSNTNDSSASAINRGIFETIYKFTDEGGKYLKGKRIQNQEKYEGVYRSRWNDEIVVGIDANLVAFDPQAHSPVKDGTLLRPKKQDKFSIYSRFNFGSVGEFVSFTFGKDKRKAKKLLWGSSPYERI